MNYKQLKEEYDDFNKSVYSNRENIIGSQVKFTTNEKHDYKKLVQCFNEEAYDYLEGNERFSGCARYWSNIPDCYIKSHVFTVYSINEQGLCSFDPNNDLCYHSLFVFDFINTK